MIDPGLRHLLKGDPTEFLLGGDDPGVVWRTLVVLLRKPADSPAVVQARLQSRQRGSAAEVLASQNGEGYWGSPAAYAARWTGTAWRLAALAQMGADPEDPRVVRGAEVLLETLQPRGGGFATTRHTKPAQCFTAEICAALVRLGFGRHPRVREAIAWLVEACAGGFQCGNLRHAGDGECPVAAVAALRLVAQHAVDERAGLTRLRSRASDWLLQKVLGSARVPRDWWVLGHPCVDRVDALDALAALARLGHEASPTILAALLGLLARQDSQGRFIQQAHVPFGEAAGQPSRWVTLKALTALAAYGGALAQTESQG